MTVGEIVAVCGLGASFVGTAVTVSFTGGKVMATLGNVLTSIEDVKKDMKESAKDQGTRIGLCQAQILSLEKFQARYEGAESKQRDLSGVVRG